MKSLYLLVSLIILSSCNSAQLVDSWKNPDIESYDPQKILVVGITSNIEARQKFEKQLKKEYEFRGVEAAVSLDYFEPHLRTTTMTEAELKVIENRLIDEGFDTVLLTKVIGVEDKVVYLDEFDDFDATHRRFRDDYYKFQEIYYNPDYYQEYKVYHAETALYCICRTKDRELIWKGYIDIIDPHSVDDTVNDYVILVMPVMEELKLVNPIPLEKKTSSKDLK